MRAREVSIAIGLCLLLVLIVWVVPESEMIAAMSSMWWLRIAAVACVLWDARRIHFSDNAAGLGRRHWVFWVVLIGWPIVGVPWYLALREWIVLQGLERRNGTKQGIEATG